MQETECPQCGEWLGVPPEFADRPVKCGACGRVIHPHERQASPPPPPPPTRSAPQFPRDDTQASRGPRFPDRPNDDSDTPPRKKGGLLWLWLLLGVGGFGLCCCGGVGVFVLSRLNGKWETYTPDNGAFTADFPNKPEYKSNEFKYPDGKAGTGHEYAAAQPLQQQWVALHYSDIPKSIRKAIDDETLLKLGVEDAKAKSTNFTSQTEAKMKVGGRYEARDIDGTITDPQHGLLQVSLRVVIVGDRVYWLIAAGKDRKKLQPMRDRFFDSFKPAEPKGAPADPKEK